MQKKGTIFTLGIICNLLLLAFFAYLFYYAKPKVNEINPKEIISVPDIKKEKMKSDIEKLNKVKDLPLNIDPSEIGKQNPYNY